MKKHLLLFLLLLAVSTSRAQTFQQFLDRINFLPMSQRQPVADSFISVCPAFPLVESDSLAHFIFTGTTTSVSLAGDATQWNPSLNLALIPGTDFWYATRVYETDARLDYKLVIGGSNWIPDPRNPKTCTGGFGPNSELRMSANTEPPEVLYYPGIPHGTIRDTSCHSNILNNTRPIKIYLPPSYPADAGGYPLLLFHDGLDYLNLAATKNILDYLIATRMIRPVIALFVPPVEREAEYAGSKIDQFTAFITTELMPYIDNRYKTSKDPSQRATLGASNGGNIALYLSIKKPGSFGKAAAQSSNVIPAITTALQNSSRLKLEFYLDIGKYDIPELIPMVQNLAALLQSKGYAYTLKDIHEGHSWGNWKEHLRLPLMLFFPYVSGNNDNNQLKNH